MPLKLNKHEKGCCGGCLGLLIFMILLTLIGSLLPTGTPQGPESKALVACHRIQIYLFTYAQDHGGKYPEGKSSTAVFQKLLDDKYASDPSLFFYPLPGKVKPEGLTLKSENVSFDVTCCLDATSPDHLPSVFLTSYRFIYKPGANATLLKKPDRSWSDWWNGKKYPNTFIAVAYVSNSACVLMASPEGTIPNFIPADFDPKGRTYHQLTPDGELPP